MSNGCQHAEGILVEVQKTEITGKEITKKTEKFFTIIRCATCKGFLRVLTPKEFKI